LYLENELLRILVVADKGADILEFLYKPIDMEFLWQSYNGLRRFNHYRPSNPLLDGHFREYYAGGWHEMLPNGAGPCNHRGAFFGQHGEATLLPWDYRIEVDEPGRVQVTFRVRTVRLPLLVEKTLTVEGGSPTLHIRERIVSEADQPIEVLWGHHPTFGWPFLERGCRVYLPPCTIQIGEELLPNSRLAPLQRKTWPMVLSRNGEELDLSMLPGAEVKSQDFIRLEELSDGWFAIVNPNKQVGFALWWDLKVFPVLGFWQVFRGAFDFPWYGMNYLAALEPACDLPSLSKAAAEGSALCLEPGGTQQVELEATVFLKPLIVQGVQRGGIVR